MDARTRFRRTCRFQDVDRFCIRHMGHWPETLIAWKEQGLNSCDGGAIHGNDMCPSVGVPLGSAYWSPFWPRFERQIIRQDDDYVTERDENGRTKLWKKNTRSELAQYLRFPVESDNDWSQIKWRLDPDNEDRYRGLPDFARNHGGINGRDYPVGQSMCGPYRMLWLMFGDIGIAYAMADSPALVHEVLRTWLELVKQSLERIFSYIDIDSVDLLEDICYKQGMMLSPDCFRRYLLPYYQELTGYLKRYSSVVNISVDTDGYVEELIPLLVEGGVNCLMPFEVQAGNDVLAVRKKWGRRLVIRGGINKLEIAKGRPEIDAELTRVLPTFVDTSGFFVCLDHQAHPDIALDDYRYYVERVATWPMR